VDEPILAEDLFGPPNRSPTPETGAPPERLRDNRDFRVVLVGQGISAIGDAVTVTAMPLLVFALTGSGAAMGVVAALETLPDLLLGLPAGALADRWDRRRLMLFADFGRGLLTATVPIASLLGWPLMPVILLVAAPINVLRVLFMAGWTASTPMLVGSRLVGPASSYFEAVFSIGFFVGPAVAGLLVGVVGAPATLAIDALSFLVSAASLTLVRRRLQADGPRPRTDLLTEIRAGVAFVARQPTLRVALGLWAAINVVPAALVPALTIYVQRDLGLGAVIFGLVVSAYGLGSVLGAFLAARLTTRLSLGAMMVGGTVAQGCVLVAVGLLGQPLVVIAAGLLAGIVGAQATLGYVTLRATITPNALLGRVGAATRMVSVGLVPIGALLGGLVLDALSGGGTLILMGLLLAVSALAAATSSALRAAPRQAPSGTMGA
jgi:MFS transporter, ENTS family, enterobactin (siderophore) exporter